MTDIQKLIYTSSNLRKLAEIEEFFSNIKTKLSSDLDEVVSDPLTIIKYKACMSEKWHIVEDAILKIDGVEVVDIRWQLKNQENSTDVENTVHTAYHDGDKIYISHYTLHGRLENLDLDAPSDNFGHDFYFYPDGSDISIYELKKQGLDTKYSPRFNSLERLLLGNYEIYDVVDPDNWRGGWQNK